MKSIVHQCLHEAVISLTPNTEGEIPIQLDYPTTPDHGEVSTNLAFILAQRYGVTAQDMVKQLLAYLPTHPAIERAECAGAGFLNFFFKREALLAVVEELYNSASSIKANPDEPSECSVLSGEVLASTQNVPSHPTVFDVMMIHYAITRTDTILHQLTQQGLFCHEKTGKMPFNRLQTIQEHVLIVLLNRYHDAAQQFDVSVMTLYLQQLSNTLHLYYNTVALLCADEALREAQLGLLKTVSFVLKKGMKLLGESRPESK